MDRETFYENVYLLTQAVKSSSNKNFQSFHKLFKEGMFDKPNTPGFQAASHYLLTIYDAERFGKQLEWPLVCKKSEAKFRNDVREFLTTIAKENPDVDFPPILASHLLHASGSKFNSIMANLSTVTLRAWIKRKNGFSLLCPKAGPAEELSKSMLASMIHNNIHYIEKTRSEMSKKSSESKELAGELIESIKNDRDELFSIRQRIADLASNAPVHPSIKPRLMDPNDSKIIQLWRDSLQEGFQDLKVKEARLLEISELSENVANIVKNIVSADTNVLDGNQLSRIDRKKLSEINELSPETQVILCRQHENGILVLENFLVLFNCILNDLRSHIEKHGFPNLFGCESQILASCEDAKSIIEHFHAMHDQIEKLTKHPIPMSDRNSRSNSTSGSVYQNLYDSVLLKASPQININLNLEPSGNEFRERLELTPVEHVQRTLFSKHKRVDDNNSQAAKIRPKTIILPRVNLDDTRTSFLSDRFTPFRAGNVSRISRRPDDSDGNIEGRYSRLFSARSKRTASRLDLSVRPLSSSSRQSSVLDMNATCDVYSASQLRSHLAKNSFPGNPEYFSPKKFTMTEICESETWCSSTIRNGRSLSPLSSSPSRRAVETANGNNEETEDNRAQQNQTTAPTDPFQSPKPSEKPTNRRVSISDLVERYKRVCGDSSIVAKRINISDHSENGQQD